MHPGNKKVLFHSSVFGLAVWFMASGWAEELFSV
jgi:hypothetical protein